MALIKCHECGNQISEDANKCPQCGAKAPAGPFWKVVIIGTLIAFLWSSVTKGPTPPPAAKSPEQIAEQKAAESRSDLRHIIAKSLSKDIKASMRDPDSLKFDSMRVNDDSSVTCAEYRAKNGFGGMNREFAILAGGKISNKASDWNRLCVGEMFDLMRAVK